MASTDKGREGAAAAAATPGRQREDEAAAALRAVENMSVALDNISAQLDPLFAVPWDTLVSRCVRAFHCVCVRHACVLGDDAPPFTGNAHRHFWLSKSPVLSLTHQPDARHAHPHTACGRTSGPSSASRSPTRSTPSTTCSSARGSVQLPKAESR